MLFKKVNKNFKKNTIYIKSVFMSVQKNINNNLNKSFENFNFLPQKLLLEDLDQAVHDYIKSLNLTLEGENDNPKIIPIYYLSQERWAEYKKNWKFLKDEAGEEVVLPFMALFRTAVKQGTSPLKRTIPKKKKFTFYKIPIFDGTVKGFELIKIPQPVWVDVDYELRFLTHYMQDVNKFYETIIMEGFSDFQAYQKVNGYDVKIVMGDASEDNMTDDITADRRFQIVIPLKINSARLVDPSKFEKVKTISRVVVNITEKTD